MANTIQIKRKTTTGIPTIGDLAIGEFCLVIPDSILYLKKDATTLLDFPITIPITVGTTAPASPSTGDLWVDTN